jgi:hypothetical protein
VLWLFFRQHLFHADDVYLLAGDEVVVPKAGKQSFGLDRFFSSVYQKPVPGLAFFSLALVSTTTRRAFPIRLEQVVRTEAEKAASKANAAAKKTKEPVPKRKPGRPKGSKNQPKAALTLSSELQRIQTLVQDLLRLISGVLPLTYLVLDGHFGNGPAPHMAQQCSLPLPHGARVPVLGLLCRQRREILWLALASDLYATGGAGALHAAARRAPRLLTPIHELTVDLPAGARGFGGQGLQQCGG